MVLLEASATLNRRRRETLDFVSIQMASNGKDKKKFFSFIRLH